MITTASVTNVLLISESVEVKPPIIMKVDAPPEDNNTITSQGKLHNSQFCINTIVYLALSAKFLCIFYNFCLTD